MIGRQEILSLLLIAISVTIFFSSIAESAIVSSQRDQGGGIFVFRSSLGNRAVLFDLCSVLLCLFLCFILYLKLPESRWILRALLIVDITLLLGPEAYQRYFEPYLLILGLLVLFVYFGKLTGRLNSRNSEWVVIILLFEISEFLLSVYTSTNA